MTTTSLTHTDLTPRVGSLVETDLSTLLSGGHAAELRELLEERSVVAIRGIEIDDDQQVAFARTLGEVESSVVGDIYKVTFDKKDNPIGAAINRATFFWHIDRTDLDVPPFALHAQREGAHPDRRADPVREHLRGLRRPAR